MKLNGAQLGVQAVNWVAVFTRDALLNERYYTGYIKHCMLNEVIPDMLCLLSPHQHTVPLQTMLKSLFLVLLLK